MATEADPIIGHWYQHLDKGRMFEVVARDEKAATVEIQYFDGDVDEIDLAAWYEQDIEPAEPPEDWTGSIDNIERDDLGYTETDMTAQDWSEPLRSVRREGEAWEKDDPEPLQDKLGEGYPDEEVWEDKP